MQRYFVKNEQIKKPYIVIQGQDVHHIKRVMRMREGSEVTVCDEDSQVFLCRIVMLLEDQVKVEIVKNIDESSELSVEVTIAQGLIKRDKAEEVVKKITELGATSYISVQMDRSAFRIEKVEAKHVTRMEKIIKEASEQSRRNRMLEYLGLIDFSTLLTLKKKYDLAMFAYEETKTNHAFKEQLSTFCGKKILVVVGPEGGISSKEATLLEKNGFVAVGLGKRILRTETAPLYVMSAIGYELEMRE